MAITSIAEAGPTDMDASGDYLYVGTQVNGVRVLQNDGAGNLEEVASIDVSLASVTGVSVDGDRLHVSGGVYSGLLIYDISDPADPKLVDQYNTDGEATGVDAANGVIAMAEGRSGASTFGCDESADLLFRDGFE